MELHLTVRITGGPPDVIKTGSLGFFALGIVCGWWGSCGQGFMYQETLSTLDGVYVRYRLRYPRMSATYVS